MATVNFKSVTKLSCGECETPSQRDVIICVTSSKVKAETCPIQTEDQPFPYSTILGRIEEMFPSSVISPPKYQYLLSYDSGQLISGQTLVEADVFGIFCDGCLAQWIRERVGGEPYLETVSEDSFIFVSQHGCEYPFTIGTGTSPFLDLLFGDGSDGDLTVLNGQSLILPSDRDFFFENLTISAGGQLKPVSPVYGNHYRIFVSDTLTIDGSLDSDGQDASGQVAGLPIQTIVASGFSFSASVGPGGGDCGGGDGGDGGTSVGAATGGDDVPVGLIGFTAVQAGGDGGKGGDGGGGASGGLSSSELSGGAPLGYPYKDERMSLILAKFNSIVFTTRIGLGGGGGGSGGGGGDRTGGTSVGGDGGGGGAGGGSVYVSAKNIIIGSNGRISANGGDGGDGGDGVLGTGSAASGGGGGAGGGGGLIYLIYETLVRNGIIEAVAGNGGDGGQSVGLGQNGVIGGDGSEGTIHLFNVKTGVMDSP